MRSSRRTWCRVCGVELLPPRWKRLCGFDVTLCEDAVACVVRFRVGQVSGKAGGQLPPFEAGRDYGTAVRSRST
jgi:hypothetical protein